MNDLFGIPGTALDVFRLLPEGTLCDVIDNTLYMAEPRTYLHQKVLQTIGLLLSNHIDETRTGEVIYLPLDIYFEELLSAVQPDLFYFSNENRSILHNDGYVYGAPDLILEITSTDEKKEKVLKKCLYEKAGVKEYFIVNPANRNVLAYSLNNDVYELIYEEEGRFTSTLLDFTFRF